MTQITARIEHAIAVRIAHKAQALNSTSPEGVRHA